MRERCRRIGAGCVEAFCDYGRILDRHAGTLRGEWQHRMRRVTEQGNRSLVPDAAIAHGEAANDPNLDWRVVVRTSRIKRRYLDDSLKAATDFLNSFYLDDLDRLIAQAEKRLSFGKALSAYLGPALPERQRVDILTDNTAMAGLVSAKHGISCPRARRGK